MLQTAGIVVDNYKLEAFKKELDENDFPEYEVFPFTKDTTVIKVKTQVYRLKKLRLLCQKLEIEFKKKN